MGDGFQFLDIILLVMIAAFIFLRLRSVLGRRMGHEQQPREEINQKRYRSDPEPIAKDDSSDNVVPMNENVTIEPSREPSPFADTPLNNTLRQIHQIDKNFNPDTFASQAEQAYEAIVLAFANGDRATLKDLLSEEVFNNFEAAIDAREKAEETMSTDILSINSSEIEDAKLYSKEAEITVCFETEMISVTKDQDGVVVNGDPHPHVIKEHWTFARNLKSRNPNWFLITTKSAD